MKTLGTSRQINYEILFGCKAKNYKRGVWRNVEAVFNKVKMVRMCTEVVIPYAKINK